MRRLTCTAFVLLLAACSSSAPELEPPAVDPATDPTIVSAVDEAVYEGNVEGEEGARIGRRIGRVAGVLAAVLGGPETETLDETVDRYRRTRDAAEAAGAVVGATKGAAEGAKRGYQLDVTFAELRQIEGLNAVRTAPDEIEISLGEAPARATLEAVAAVLAKVGERSLLVELAGETAPQVSETLVALGVPAANVALDDDESGFANVLLRIHHAL